MTVAFGWSPDSRLFLTAILFPRLRVDNGFRVRRHQRDRSGTNPVKPARQTGPSNRPVKPSSHHTPSPHPVTTPRPHLASPPLQVWSCAGGLLHEERMEELSLATWRPAPAERFAPPTDADVRAYPAKAAPKPTAQAKKCASSSRLTRDLGGVDSWRRPLFA